MLSYKWCMCIFFAFLRISVTHEQLVDETIVVDQSGKSCNYTTIQAAIDSIPSNNERWIRIKINPGVYREQVLIPRDKPFIYLKGAGKRNTKITWDGHDDISAGATFASEANNTLAEDITFANSYNSDGSSNPMARAVAARILGDKSVFRRCGFFSLQDTLWDAEGRHYFELCTIYGAVDFIFGAGQSLYQSCLISVAPLDGGAEPGYITAQGRGVPSDTSGFVFKHCKITGKGRAYLGRPWRDYARVLFYNTSMSEAVVPQGWGIWDKAQHVDQLTLSEYSSRGPGANSSERVPWAKKMSEQEANNLASISFIDNQEGWLKTAFQVFATDSPKATFVNPPEKDSPKTIFVDPSGKDGLKSIQAAINSVPSNNKIWTTIDIKSGFYREQITIPSDKPFIYLKGSGKRNTIIVWDAHNGTAVFTSEADNILAKDITFTNSYNAHRCNPMMVATAARIQGDKSLFYQCGFYGLQGTLWDDSGRHYFKYCTIHGAVDYIYGAAQSLYDSCGISVASLNGTVGSITAQGRGDPKEKSGFMFNNCSIFGDGKALLGMPWRDYARVVFYNTSMTDAVVPQGWGIWDKAGKEKQLTLSENDSHGPGANSSERVKWAKNLSESEAKNLASLSFIDNDNEDWVKKAFDILDVNQVDPAP